MSKKLLIINNGLSGGGIERASSSMANAFDAKGYQVSVVALYRREHFFTLNPDVEFIEPSFSSSNRYVYALQMMCYLRRCVARICPDVILAYGEWTNPYVILATRFMRIPVFLSDRMSPALRMGAVQRLMKRLLYRYAQGVIAQTSFARDVIRRETGNNRIEVIPNPVNVIERIACEPRNQIISIGRLTREKGHRILVEAFSKLKNKEWQLMIVGDGGERPSLETLAQSLHVADRVIFAGHQKQLAPYLSAAQIFVLPSLLEGYPNALIEAMSLPMACVSSDCMAGPSDIISDGINGLLVEPGNSEAMAVALDRLIENEELRCRLAANASEVRQTLNFEKITMRYLNFILQK